MNDGGRMQGGKSLDGILPKAGPPPKPSFYGVDPHRSKVRIGSNKLGVVEGLSTYCRSGDHRPEGLLVAIGAGLKPGRIEQTISTMDFAPTISFLLGVQLPEVGGKPVTEIVNVINL